MLSTGYYSSSCSVCILPYNVLYEVSCDQHLSCKVNNISYHTIPYSGLLLLCYIFIKRLKTVLAEIINIKFVISFLRVSLSAKILGTLKCFVKKRPGYLKLLNDACISFLCEDKCMNK